MNHKSFTLSVLFTVVSLFLSACGVSAPPATATPTLMPTAAVTLTPLPTLPPTSTPPPTFAPVDCKIVSAAFAEIQNIVGLNVPAFDYEVEGFLPGELLAITLSGAKFVANGFSFDAPPTQDQIAANSEGHAVGTIAVQPMIGNAGGQEIPPELTFSVRGEKSGCEVTQTVTWP